MNAVTPAGGVKSNRKLGILGSLAIDELFHFDGSFRDAIKTDALQHLSVSFLSQKIESSFGGVAGNIAYGLSLLKTSAFICSRIGESDQDYGDILKKWGMDLSFLEMVPGDTAKAYILTDQQENQIAHFCPGVVSESAPAFQIPLAFKAADFFVVAPEGSRHRMMEALKEAKEAQLRVIYAPGQMSHAFNSSEALELTKGCEGLIMNEYEWKIWSHKLLEKGESVEDLTQWLIVTRGSDGVDLIQNKDLQHFPVSKKVLSKNPTGAGDAFLSGILASLQKDLSLSHGIQSGMILASACVQHEHPQNYPLSKEQVHELKMLGWLQSEA